jgi:hypothetical protein
MDDLTQNSRCLFSAGLCLLPLLLLLLLPSQLFWYRFRFEKQIRTDDFMFTQDSAGMVTRHPLTGRNLMIMLFLVTLLACNGIVIYAGVEQILDPDREGHWPALLFFIGSLVFLLWLARKVLQVQHAPRLTIDPELQQVSLIHRQETKVIPFAEIKRLVVAFHENPDPEMAGQGSYRIVLALNDEKTIPLAGISGVKKRIEKKMQEFTALLTAVLPQRTHP